MKWFISIFGAISILLGVGGCSAEPADGPGLCKLRCSDSIITASDYKITSISPDLSLKCSGTATNTRETARLTSKFSITRQRIAGSGTEDVAVPNVSIRPVLLGNIDETIDNDEVLGVYTDSSEFCSDQCGIVTIDFGVYCPPQGDGEATVSILSGGLYSKTEVFRVTIQSASFEDDDDASSDGSN